MMRTRKRSKEWLMFIAAAIALHVALLLYVKPSFFAIFSRSPNPTVQDATRGRTHPDAILYIPIEIEDSDEEKPTERITELSDIEKPIEPTDVPSFPKAGRPSDKPVDLDDVLGEAAQTLPQGPGTDIVKIPPRPVEITWPDTRGLEHCLGHHIDVRIQVDENGVILHVEAQEEEQHPPDCLRAALESAHRIVFEPGKINGRPAKMWTQIRIDFQEKK